MLKPAVIIDSGSRFTRGGFAGQEQPQCVLRTVLLPPCSVGTPWEPRQPCSVGTPWEPRQPCSVGTPWEPRQPCSVGIPWEPRQPCSMGTPWELRQPCSMGTPWEPRQPCSVGTPWEAWQPCPGTESPRRRPLKRGLVEDWDGMKTLWGHLLCCCLKVSPEEHPVLLAESPSCPAAHRAKAAEVLFEGLGVPALHLANSGFLSLCAHGRVTGLAVEAGAAVSHVTSVWGGQTLRKGTRSLGVAGDHLSRHLHGLLLQSHTEPSALQALTKKVLTQLKEQCCYVSLDYEGDLQEEGSHPPARFQTPDGRWITLGKERFCCPEPLFRPELLQLSCPGLHQLAWQSLQTVPEQARRHVLGNIVLSGGSSMFPGFPERMCLELNLLFQGAGVHIEVLASPRRGTAAWAGGSMAASLTSFQHTWMTKGEYQEHGAEYVHRKFQ